MFSSSFCDIPHPHPDGVVLCPCQGLVECFSSMRQVINHVSSSCSCTHCILDTFSPRLVTEGILFYNVYAQFKKNATKKKCTFSLGCGMCPESLVLL